MSPHKFPKVITERYLALLLPGETQDFLVADVDGGLHRIRYTIHGVGYRSAARTTCGSRRFHDSSSVSIDCTQIRFRDGA